MDYTTNANNLAKSVTEYFINYRNSAMSYQNIHVLINLVEYKFISLLSNIINNVKPSFYDLKQKSIYETNYIINKVKEYKWTEYRWMDFRRLCEVLLVADRYFPPEFAHLHYYKLVMMFAFLKYIELYKNI